jgi:hypothetical protein
MYKGYCQGYEKSMDILKQLREKNKSFRKFLNKLTDDLPFPEPIESFLIRSVQGIP